MGVVCATDPALADFTAIGIDNTTVLPGDVITVVVFARASGGGLGTITPDVGWLTAQVSGGNTSNAATVFVGVFPDPVPPSIAFSATNANRWAINAQINRGVDQTTPVADSDSDAHFVAAASQAFSVGSVTAPVNGSYLLYCLACFSPDQTTFEAGPTPSVPNIQLGRTVALNPAAEVGIWAELVNAGASGVFTQTVTQASSQVAGLAVLLVLQPICATSGTP